jgi:hypothetical protein
MLQHPTNKIKTKTRKLQISSKGYTVCNITPPLAKISISLEFGKKTQDLQRQNQPGSRLQLAAHSLEADCNLLVSELRIAWKQQIVRSTRIVPCLEADWDLLVSALHLA